MTSIDDDPPTLIAGPLTDGATLVDPLPPFPSSGRYGDVVHFLDAVCPRVPTTRAVGPLSEAVYRLVDLWDIWEVPYAVPLRLSGRDEDVFYTPVLSALRVNLIDPQRWDVPVNPVVWVATDALDNRAPLRAQVERLATYGGMKFLMEATSEACGWDSWVCVLWQPVMSFLEHRAKHRLGAFLVYHRLRLEPSFPHKAPPVVQWPSRRGTERTMPPPPKKLPPTAERQRPERGGRSFVSLTVSGFIPWRMRYEVWLRRCDDALQCPLYLLSAAVELLREQRADADARQSIDWHLDFCSALKCEPALAEFCGCSFLCTGKTNFRLPTP